MNRSAITFILKPVLGALSLTIALVLAMQVNIAYADTVAEDDFESGGLSGGTGWLGAWQTSGDVEVITQGDPQAGTWHMRLRSGNGVAYRDVNLSSWEDIELTVWVKTESFEGSEFANLLVGSPGSLTEVGRWTDDDDDNEYHHFTIELSQYDTSGTFRIQFESHMGSNGDRLFLDAIEFTGDDPDEESTDAVTPILECAQDNSINDELALIDLNFPSSTQTPQGLLYPISASFTNISDETIVSTYFRVETLEYVDLSTPAPELSNAVRGGNGVGSEIDAVLPGGSLEVGESFNITFDILLPSIKEFTFLVNAFIAFQGEQPHPVAISVGSDNNSSQCTGASTTSPALITLDGEFDDWSGHANISDPSGDARKTRGDILKFYWGDNDNDDTAYWMVQRPTGQFLPVRYSVHLDMNDDGTFDDDVDRIIEVHYVPLFTRSFVLILLRRADTNKVIHVDANNDWGDTWNEGGSRVEFGLPFDELGFSFGSTFRMYVESNFDDRAPDTGDIQWSPVPVLGYIGLGIALVAGGFGIWWFKLRRYEGREVPQT